MGKERKGRDGITQLADGRWQASVTVGYVNGKQQRKAVYGKAYAACKGKRVVLMRNQQQGIAPTDDRVTVEKYLAAWLATVKEKNQEATYVSYKGAVDLYIVPSIGKK